MRTPSTNTPPPPDLGASHGPSGRLVRSIPNLSLPPLAPVNNTLFPKQVPDYLQELYEKVIEAASAKNGLIIIDAIDEERHQSFSSLREVLRHREDLVTLTDLALRNDPRLNGYQFVVPADPNEEMRELSMRAHDADEVTNRGYQYIVLLTNRCTDGIFEETDDKERFLTKLSRGYVESIACLSAPKKQEQNILEDWCAHVKDASIDEVRKLFFNAAKNPGRHPMGDMYQKLNEPFPAESDQDYINHCKNEYAQFLQLLQTMVWSPFNMTLVLYGEPSTGKSTLMRGAANFFEQIGQGSNYFLVDESGSIRLEGRTENRGIGFNTHRRVTCIDQIDRANSELDIDLTGIFDPMEKHWKVIATSNLGPQELINRFGGEFKLVARRSLETTGPDLEENRETLLTIPFVDGYPLSARENPAKISHIAHPDVFSQHVLVFLRWEGRQWNVDHELLEKAQFI